ncbi:hypothetical protein [Streptomyces sp. NPDC050560]|uniref:hypothetical protein n=1 Tax=Streptomyces sp. NPDC050560 TaxID=3365630 RepID=UPI00379E80CA
MAAIAVPELRRYAPDALRMVGIPLGQADECADMLVWTQAVTGGALAWLAAHRARLSWYPRPRARVVAESESAAVVDARGGSLLELGVRIADFARAEAAAHGTRVVRVRQVYGTVFLPYLIARAAGRGTRIEADAPAAPLPGAHEPRGELTLRATAPVEPGEGLDTAAYRAAVDRGIALDDADFTTVTSLFEMLRVPTSERSRSHAG